MQKLRGTYMDNTISYTRRREDSAVYKVTIRKQLPAMQMRSVKGHLYNNGIKRMLVGIRMVS